MIARALCLVWIAAAAFGCGSNDASQLFNEGPVGGAGGSGGNTPDGSAGTGGGASPGDAGKDAVSTDGEPPPDSGCAPGQTWEQACGLNGRGTLTYTCDNGAWQPGQCVDPDVCPDGTQRQEPCGASSEGLIDQVCNDGQWQDAGECVLPQPVEGRWACSNDTCVPLLGDASCGDGTCAPASGESPSSCPSDCDALLQQSGQKQPCEDALDCAFYAWTASGTGYWECRWEMNGSYCNAVTSGSYCGATGFDYCYYGSVGIETPATCPQDCANKLLNQNTGEGCEEASDCIFLDWPVNGP